MMIIENKSKMKLTKRADKKHHKLEKEVLNHADVVATVAQLNAEAITGPAA